MYIHTYIEESCFHILCGVDMAGIWGGNKLKAGTDDGMDDMAETINLLALELYILEF